MPAKPPFGITVNSWPETALEYLGACLWWKVLGVILKKCHENELKLHKMTSYEPEQIKWPCRPQIGFSPHNRHFKKTTLYITDKSRRFPENEYEKHKFIRNISRKAQLYIISSQRISCTVELSLCLQACAKSQKLHHPLSLSISFPEPAARLLISGMCLNVACAVNIAASAWKWDFSKIGSQGLHVSTRDIILVNFHVCCRVTDNMMVFILSLIQSN